MTWIFLAIGSHFAWAIENVVTKYTVDKRIKNPYIFLILFTILEGVAFLIIPFVDFCIPSPKIILLLVLAGGLYFFGGFPYIKAMQMEEVTRINILWGLIPVISLFFGYFIGDRVTLQQGVALFILIIGTILAGIHLGEGRWLFSKAFWLMFAACVCFSAYGILMRYILQMVPFFVAFLGNLFFDVLISFIVLVFHKKWRQETKQVIFSLDKKFILVLILVVATALLGVFLNQKALSYTQASLVFSMEGFQTIFVFVITGFLTLFLPRILKEKFDRKNLLLKLGALVFMVTGIVVLNLK